MMMVMLACRSVLGAIAGPYQMFAPNGTNNPLIPISETVVVLFQRGFDVLFPFFIVSISRIIILHDDLVFISFVPFRKGLPGFIIVDRKSG